MTAKHQGQQVPGSAKIIGRAMVIKDQSMQVKFNVQTSTLEVNMPSRERVVKVEISREGRIVTPHPFVYAKENSDSATDHNKEYEEAFSAYESSKLLKDPFWINQFALKNEQYEQVVNSFNLMSAVDLKKEIFRNWKATDGKAALNKRAERNQVLSVMIGDIRCYPLEQFEVDIGASSPKISKPFSIVLEAWNKNGEISQVEFLYWLCSEQQLPIPPTNEVDDALEANDTEAAWEALRSAGQSKKSSIRPLDLLKHGDAQTVLRLFEDWTESQLDSHGESHEDIINAIKSVMVIEGISINELITR